MRKEIDMTVKEALKQAETKFSIVTKNGEILYLNGKGNKHSESIVKKIDIIRNISDGSPVVTAIRI